jgi:hypothetical protein
VEFAPTAGDAVLRIDRLWPVIETQHQHSLGTELDAQAAALAPVVKNVNLAPRQMTVLGTRFVPNLYAGWVMVYSHLCSSSNTDGSSVDDDTQKGASCQAPDLRRTRPRATATTITVAGTMERYSLPQLAPKYSRVRARQR